MALNRANRGGVTGIYSWGCPCPFVYNISLTKGLRDTHVTVAPFIIKGCRYALLTYAQCGDLDPWRIVELFANLRAECIIGRELHEDGGIHLHTFVDFGRQFSSRTTTVFDVGGFHPNIEQSRGTPEKGYDYAIKDGDVVAGGLERPRHQSGSGADSAHTKWSTIVMAETADEFWELCHSLVPEHLVRSYPSLRKYCDWKFAPVDTVYTTPVGVWIDASAVEGINQWLLQADLGSGALGRR